MKRFLTNVSLQHEPKVSDVITLVKKTFFARGSYEILYAVLRTRSDIKEFTRKECCHYNEVERKIIVIFFCFGCATQNKALDTVKLISN